MTLTFVPFEKWLKQNPDLPADVDCDECDGNGKYECDCEHCRGHECEECNGTGRISNPTVRKIYDAECDKARTLLAAQRGGEGE